MVQCRRYSVGGGVASTPSKFLFVENLGKIPENLGKASENLGKVLENPGKNGAGAQRLQKYTIKIFSWRSHGKQVFTFFVENLWQKAHKNVSGKFEEIRAKILRTPENLPAPTPMFAQLQALRAQHNKHLLSVEVS